jgi:hypothetical protein
MNDQALKVRGGETFVVEDTSASLLPQVPCVYTTFCTLVAAPSLFHRIIVFHQDLNRR